MSAVNLNEIPDMPKALKLARLNGLLRRESSSNHSINHGRRYRHGLQRLEKAGSDGGGGRNEFCARPGGTGAAAGYFNPFGADEPAGERVGLRLLKLPWAVDQLRGGSNSRRT